MKRSVLFLVSLLVVATMVAAPVSQQRAMQVAQQFIPVPDNQAQAPGMRAEEQPADIVYTHPMPKSGRPAFYVVNVGGSFVIVSADDVAHQVLGYNLGKKWPVAANGEVQLPPQVKGFFDDLAAQMEAAIEANSNHAPDAEWSQPLSAPRRRMMSEIPDSVGPLLTSTWDQGQYYNALCPEDQGGPGGHVWAGCIATAMAQIINYWGQQMPIKTRGIHSYNSNYGTLTVNYDSAHYDFAHMPSALTSTNTQQEIDAVAKLMYDCGVATNMAYSSTESGSYDIDARVALVNHFRFSPNTSEIVKSLFSDAEWHEILRGNLAANHPILYSGQGSGGHAFVCDGYKTDGFYHFNFGWGGFSDGWYLISVITPDGQRDYSNNQSAVVEIVPDSTSNVVFSQMTQGTSTFTISEPLEFYHSPSYNKYPIPSYNNPCNGIVYFISADTTKQLVADIISYEDQNVMIYDGIVGNQLAALYAGGENSLSPAVSTSKNMRVDYQGNMFVSGYHLRISQNSDCRMVSNILVAVDTTTIHLSWTENGTAAQWEIEYGEKGFQLGDGTTIIANTNIMDITFPKRLTEYDMYIRSVCGNDQQGKWRKMTVKTDAPYWQDIVTSQPAGFNIDSTGVVYISTPEALTWWAKTENQRDVVLLADIDLSGYKWKPVEGYNFNGNGHVISNAYIAEDGYCIGFFSYLFGECKDLGLVNFYVCSSGSNVGGMCGQMGWSGLHHATMINCYGSNGFVSGSDYVGGLIGFAQESVIRNCYANASVVGSRWSGVMVGNAEHQTISNCYAAGKVMLRSFCYNAGIAAYISTGNIDHCYSVELPMGVVGYTGSTVINDTATFYRENDDWILHTHVMFDGDEETVLLNALNKGVQMKNDDQLKVWTKDSLFINNGYPVFGGYYQVKCSNIDSLFVTNCWKDSIPAVIVRWKESEERTLHQIRYLRNGFPIDSAVTVIANHNPDTLYGIPLGHLYDISIRSLCDDGSHSAWKTVQTIIDLPYWTDMVTEQPLGYVEDENGNVEISSAEGLAWLSVLCNGLHNQEPRTFEDKHISLTTDISLAGYRWRPIGENKAPAWRYFSGQFDGNNHSISDIYINDSKSFHGLFGLVYIDGYAADCFIKNTRMVGGSVSSIQGDVEYEGYSTNQSCIGGLAGEVYRATEVSNCHSSVNVSGLGAVGSLIGHAFIQNGEMNIMNCSATGSVSGREGCGGLIGRVYGNINVKNCYSTGNVYMHPGEINAWYRGGLIGNFMCDAYVYNCYSTGEVDRENATYVGKVIGCPYMNTHIQYLYGEDISNSGMGLFGNYCEHISDTTQFHRNDSDFILLTPITIGDSTYNNLLDALNAWVVSANDPTLFTWKIDTLNQNGGYPVLGDIYEPSCYNPIEVNISNVTILGDSIIKTKIEWEQEGTPLQWEILYVNAQQSMDSGTIVTVDSNPCVITNLPVGQLLDFYVRAVCDSTECSGWSKCVTYLPDKLHWTEVVTSQPNGYQEDGDGNLYISTAEGLAWLSSVVNGLNGEFGGGINNINKVYLTSDINMSQYRWTAMEAPMWRCVFDGNGHTITGLYCNEYAGNQGLFAGFYNGSVHNLILTDCFIKGLQYNAAIAARGTNAYNCIVNGEVTGVCDVGGISGPGGSFINCAFVGSVSSRTDIKYADCYNGFVGGIAGTDGMVTNSYVAAEIPWSVFSGIICGSNGRCDYSYAMSYPTELQITYDNFDTNSSFFINNEWSWTLNTPPYINGAFYSDLLSALNAWVDANNVNGQYRHWIADTAGVNGGFPIFAPMPVEPVGPITEIDNYKETNRPARKVFERGHLYILLPDGTRFDATGRKVE